MTIHVSMHMQTSTAELDAQAIAYSLFGLQVSFCSGIEVALHTRPKLCFDCGQWALNIVIYVIGHVH